MDLFEVREAKIIGGAEPYSVKLQAEGKDAQALIDNIRVTVDYRGVYKNGARVPHTTMVDNVEVELEFTQHISQEFKQGVVCRMKVRGDTLQRIIEALVDAGDVVVVEQSHTHY
jgi:hypothetical protein